jgi:integrase
VIADLNGKGGHIRTVPMPNWVKTAIDEWAIFAGINSGPLFRAINKAGRVWGNGFTPKVIWSIVKEGAANCGLVGLAPHDLRRTCARLCHQAGGELEQIQFLLGHVSIETTERYLGCKQRFQNAVNDAIGLDPNGT